jgi:phosphoglycolate phosphatase
LSKYRCVIWDWNGTLLDDVDACLNVMNGILSKRDLPALNADRYKEIFCFPVKDYYDLLGFDYSIEPFERISVEFISEYQKESMSSRLNEDCIKALELNKANGIKQVILSASKLENLREQVEYFGIQSYFDELLGLSHIHATSKVDIGKKWLAESGYEKDEVILIGDTMHDFETACGIGCNCILLANGHQSKKRIASLGVPVIDSLLELQKYLE